MTVVFFGSSRFSVPILKALHEKHHRVLLVVTTPDKKKGRGQKIASTVVKQAAMELDLPVSAPEKLSRSEVVEKVKELKPDFVVIASYGKMVPASIFQAAKVAALNVHPSLLPKYRGASPIQAALLAGDPKTGVSIAEVTDELDAGDLFGQIETAVLRDENAYVLSERLSELGSKLLLDIIAQFQKGVIARKPQDHTQMTYAGKLERESGRIDWNKAQEQIHNQVRAYYPWPAAFTFFRGQRLKILKTGLSQIPSNGKGPGFVHVNDPFFLVETKTNPIAISKVQLEGRREIEASEFARGQRIQEGERFE